jgi:predicted transcriptional regulator with HTH domain
MDLIGLFRSKTREKILRFFFLNTEKKCYLRELERILHLPVGNIRRELVSLEKLGLFKKEKVANLVYYSLNKESPFFDVFNDTIFKVKGKGKDTKRSKSKNLFVIKKDDLDLLFSRINELKNILENFQISRKLPQKKIELEKFLDLRSFLKNREVVKVRRIPRNT